MTAVEWVNQAVGHEVGEELNRLEAEMVTAKIKSYVGVAWVLLYEAHQRKAHKAMGYETWADYVAAEFDMSRSRSYQLISQAKIVMEISAAVSTDVDITEAEARDLAGHVEEAKAAASDAADALGEAATAAERADAAREAVERVRFDAVQRAAERRAREAAEKAAAELAGQNADGEVLVPGSEPREDAEGVGADSPAPAPSKSPDERLGEYRKAWFAEAKRVHSGLLDFDPDELVPVLDAIERDALRSLAVAAHQWADRVEKALSPSLTVVNR